MNRFLIHVQDLYLQNVKTFGTAKGGKNGEAEYVWCCPPLSTCCWTVMRCSRKRKAWLCARLVTGAAQSGLGEEKLSPTPLLQEISVTSTSPGPLPGQAQVWLCVGPSPQPQCAVQINQQFTGGMAIKGNS